MNPLYATLYIDTGKSIFEIQDEVDFILGNINDSKLEVVVYRNDQLKYDYIKRKPYHFIECSRFYAEVGLIEEENAILMVFWEKLAEIIRKLRVNGHFVTASCSFEDYIQKATGWNWSTETTEPPGR